MKNGLINRILKAAAFPDHYRFMKNLCRIGEFQEQLLMDNLARNAESEFGRKYGFSTIHSVKEYRKRVPVLSYVDFFPYIRRMLHTDNRILTKAPVRLLEPTGGSSSGSKLIPYTPALKREFRSAVNTWLFDIYTNCPSLLQARSYWSISPLNQAQPPFETTIPVGFDSDAEYLGALGQIINQVFVVPEWVKFTNELENFRYLTLFYLLRSRDLGLISVWNPTFLLQLLNSLGRHLPALIKDIGRGTLTLPFPEQALVSGRRVKADKKRALDISRVLEQQPGPGEADTLRPLLWGQAGTDGEPGLPGIFGLQRPQEALWAGAIREDRGSFSSPGAGGTKMPLGRLWPLKSLWPQLQLISCWQDAESRFYAEQIKQQFPGVYLQPKGLIATEGIVSIPLSAAGGAVPAYTSHFLEFLPVDAANRGEECRLVTELQPGKVYQVILTTGGGLYRYNLEDQVRVTAWFKGLPVLEFLGRATVADLTGEKLEANHARTVVDRALARFDLDPRFLFLAPEQRKNAGYYLLYLETTSPPPSRQVLERLAAEIEQGFKANFHYAYSRRLGQLGALEIRFIESGGTDMYKRACLARGQRLGDIKPLFLSPKPGWLRYFQGGEQIKCP